MKKYLVLLLLMTFCASLTLVYGQVGYTPKFLNPTISGGTLKVDIYLLRTGSTNFRVGDGNFWFNYNSAALSNPTVSMHGGFDISNDNDYLASTLTTGTFNTNPYVSYNIFFNSDATGDDGAGSNILNTGDGTFIAQIQFTITNASATTDLTWQSGGYALTNDFGSSITASGNWTDGNVTDAALPVELASFNAIARGRNVELTWNTATETNNAGFEVERKVVGTEWTKVGFVEGNGTTASEHSYSYTDKADGINVYTYRLKQIDRDGNFSYSGEVEVTTALTTADYALSANYPNPFNPTTKFTFAVQNNEQVAVKVFNSIGQEVATLFNGIAEANTLYEMNFNATGLASGTYFYMLRSNGRYEIKKMMLMK